MSEHSACNTDQAQYNMEQKKQNNIALTIYNTGMSKCIVEQKTGRTME